MILLIYFFLNHVNPLNPINHGSDIILLRSQTLHRICYGCFNGLKAYS